MPTRKPDNWTPQSTQSRVDSVWASLQSRRDEARAAAQIDSDED